MPINCSSSCSCSQLQALRDQNPAAYQTLLDIADLLLRKSADYSPSSPFLSFVEASLSAEVDIDSVFRVMIGVKTARETALLSSGDEPNYESLQDTRMDRAAYSVLQCAYHSLPHIALDAGSGESELQEHGN